MNDGKFEETGKSYEGPGVKQQVNLDEDESGTEEVDWHGEWLIKK